MSGLSPPVANSTVVEDDISTENFPSLDDLQKVTTPKPSHKEFQQQPGTQSDVSTPGSKFHRALFARPLSGNRVTPAEYSKEEKENRPSTAPGRRLPFVTDFSNVPQKRPATAAVYDHRRAKAEKLEFLGRKLHLLLDVLCTGSCTIMHCLTIANYTNCIHTLLTKLYINITN